MCDAHISLSTAVQSANLHVQSAKIPLPLWAAQGTSFKELFADLVHRNAIPIGISRQSWHLGREDRKDGNQNDSDRNDGDPKNSSGVNGPSTPFNAPASDFFLSPNATPVVVTCPSGPTQIAAGDELYVIASARFYSAHMDSLHRLHSATPRPTPGWHTCRLSTARSARALSPAADSSGRLQYPGNEVQREEANSSHILTYTNASSGDNISRTCASPKEHFNAPVSPPPIRPLLANCMTSTTPIRHLEISSAPATTGVSARRFSTNCPAGHLLKAMVTPQSGWGCDVCTKSPFEKGTKMYGCRKCRWISCSTCRK